MDGRWARRTARARKSGEKNSVEVHYRSTPQTHMKITCQSCQSKYNVADDKVTGKIVKIRCRKCGATIVVDGTTVAETGGNVTSSAAPAAAASSLQPPAGEPAPWHVNVSDNDQRTMTLSEIVDAYNASTITQETFIWTEGMEDWKPLKDVEAVVGALHDNAAPASIAAQSVHGADAALASVRGPVREAEPAPRAALRSSSNEARPVAYASPLDTQAEAPRAEPKRAALKRETRGRDIFGGGDLQTSRASNDASGGVLTSAPLMPQASLALGDEAANKLTGERNENSVLFSLAMLTKNADERAPTKATTSTTATHEDSGLIDLKALAAKAESIRPTAMGDAMFSPALGSGGVVSAPFGAVGSSLGEAPQKSRLPVLIVIGAAVIAVVVLAVFIGVRIGTSNSAASAVPAATATASAAPSSSASPETAASASAAAEASAAASASAVAAASAAPKPKPAVGGTYHAPAQAMPVKPASAPATGATPTAAPAVAPKKSDCGCNGDLMCLMKCSTAH
jgi:predicted Zn finger-like uncharacterized protein